MKTIYSRLFLLLLSFGVVTTANAEFKKPSHHKGGSAKIGLHKDAHKKRPKKRRGVVESASTKKMIYAGAPVITTTLHPYTKSVHDTEFKPEVYSVSLAYTYYVNSAANHAAAQESFWADGCDQYNVSGVRRGVYTGGFRVTRHAGTWYDPYTFETLYKRTYHYTCMRIDKSDHLAAAFKGLFQYYFDAAERDYDEYNRTGSTSALTRYFTNSYKGEFNYEYWHLYSQGF